MATEAQNIIRAIRRALDMTQTEFAQALGWSPGTISRWESGRAEPSRLALKIILAFGEERRVRYRPRTPVVGLPVPVTSVPAPRPVPVDEVQPAVELAQRSADPWRATIHAERPRWEVAFSVRVAMKDRPRADSARRRPWLRSTAAIAASVCAGVLIGVPMVKRAEPQLRAIPQRTVAPPQVESLPPAPPRPARVPTAHVAPKRAPVPTARLEAVTLIGGRHEASFRIGADTITVAEGEPLGERHAARISVEGVELADATGAVRLVKLGGTAPLE